MPRRYLKRVKPPKNEEFDKKPDPEIEMLHALQDQERKITLDKKPPSGKGLKAVKVGTRFALDAAGNTDLYMRFINMRIKNQISQIDHVKKLKERFDDEIEMLQSELLEQKDQLEKVKEEIRSNKADNQ